MCDTPTSRISRIPSPSASSQYRQRPIAATACSWSSINSMIRVAMLAIWVPCAHAGSGDATAAITTAESSSTMLRLAIIVTSSMSWTWR
jgi:hypothetical protein